MIGKVVAATLASTIGLIAADANAEPAEPSRAALISESGGILAGRPFTVALRLTIDDGWHTYWRNPGDAGAPTVVDWRLPEGFAGGALQWPRPERFPAGPLMSYGYGGEVMLLSEITPPQTLTAGSAATITADAEWLVCREICIPQSATLSLKLPVLDTPPAIDAQSAARFDAARATLPEPAREAVFTGNKDTLTLDLAGGGIEDASDVWFYPFDPLILDQRADQIAAVENGRSVLKLSRAEPCDAIPSALHGVITFREAGRDRAIAIDAYPILN